MIVIHFNGHLFTEHQVKLYGDNEVASHTIFELERTINIHQFIMAALY